ncbi:MAG: cardiolipin synthase B [Betaproteobacteria bacterium]|nr:cardiolipin synthase B [Betaproteobacteria bacterium]
MRFPRGRFIIWIVVAIIATLGGIVLVLNLLPGEKQVEQRIPRLYSANEPAYQRSMGVLLGPAILQGNRVDTLLNGAQIFPAMLGEIEKARQTITFETYIYWEGAIGEQFAEKLAERSRAGVKIHVLLDWVGSQRMKPELLDRLTAAGVEIERYHPLSWYHVARLNNRTHRKLLVVDGRVGFTGGVGIADKWDGNAQDADHWRDTHFRVEGPVVAQMQATFLDNWMKVRGEVLHGDAYFPPLTPHGSQPAQMFSTSPSGGSESMHLMYLLAITAARQSIDLSSAYFVPDEMTIQSLIDAAQRGVRIRVIVPGTHTDSETVRRASRATWGPMLKAGVKIFEYQPTMFHVKMMVVDGLVASFGSTNFDERSFRLNDEANLNVYAADFAGRQLTDFERDLGQTREITYTQWFERPLAEKVWEHLAALLRSQL